MTIPVPHPQTFSWVKGALDSSMESVISTVIEAERESNFGRLDEVPSELHKIQGSLQMIELDAAGTLASGLEDLCQHIQDAASVREQSQGVQVLRWGLEALQSYINAMSRQAKVSPLTLADNINQVRSQLGEEQITRFDLFTPPLDMLDLNPADGDGEATPATVIPEDARSNLILRLRRKYRRELLTWLARQSAEGKGRTALGRMQFLLDNLQKISSLDISQQLWWVAKGVLDAVAEGRLTVDTALKSQLARLEREMARMQEESNAGIAADPPDELLRRMLFLLGPVEDSDSDRIQRIQQQLGLRDWFGIETEADGKLGAIRKALVELGNQFGESRFDDIQSRVSGFFAAEADNERVLALGELESSLGELAEAAEARSLDTIAELCHGIIRTSKGLDQSDDEVTRTASDIKIASSILFLRDGVVNPESVDTTWVHAVASHVDELRALADQTESANDRAIRIRKIAEFENRHALTTAGKELHRCLRDVEEAYAGFEADRSRVERLESAVGLLYQVGNLLTMVEFEDAARVAHQASALFSELSMAPDSADSMDPEDVAFAVAALGVAADNLTHSRWEADSVLEDAAERLTNARQSLVEASNGEATTALNASPVVEETPDDGEAQAQADLVDRVVEISKAFEAGDWETALSGFASVAVAPGSRSPDEVAALAEMGDGVVRDSLELGHAPEGDQKEFVGDVLQQISALVSADQGSQLVLELPHWQQRFDDVRRATDAAGGGLVPDPSPQLVLSGESDSEASPDPIQLLDLDVDIPAEGEDDGQQVGSIDDADDFAGLEDLSGLLQPEVIDISAVEEAAEESLNADPDASSVDGTPMVDQVPETGSDDLSSGVEEDRVAGVDDDLPSAVETSEDESVDDAPVEALVIDTPVDLPPAGETTEHHSPLDSTAYEGIRETDPDTHEVTVSAPDTAASSAAMPGEGSLQGLNLLDKDLKEIFTDEFGRHLQSLEKSLERLQGLVAGAPETAAVLDELDDCVHTLAGNCRNLGYDEIAVCAEFCLERLRDADGSDELSSARAGFAANLPLMQSARDEISADGAYSRELAARLLEPETAVVSQNEPDQAASVDTVQPRQQDPVQDVGEAIDEEIRQIFLEESHSILGRINQALLQWRDDGDDGASLPSIRREFHTLKGSAAATGYTDISELSHGVETLLDEARFDDGMNRSRLIDLLEELHDGLAAELGFLDTGGVSQLPMMRRLLAAYPEGAEQAVTREPASEAGDEDASDTAEEEPAPEPAAEAESATAEEASAPVSSAEDGAAESWVEDDDAAAEGASAPVPSAEDGAAESWVEDDDLAAEEASAPVSSAEDGAAESWVEDDDLATEESSAPVPAMEESTVETSLESADDRVAGAVESASPVFQSQPTAPESSSGEASAPPLPATDAGALSIPPDSPEQTARSWMPPEVVVTGGDKSTEQSSGGTLRIQNSKLAELINASGELGLVRTQLQNTLDATRMDLDVLRTSMNSIREGLREIEVEADAQIRAMPEQQAVAGSEDFDPLQLDRYSRLQAKSRELAERLDQLAKVERELVTRASDISGALQQQLHLGDRLQSGLMGARMVAVGEYLPRLRYLVRETSRQAGKEVDLRFHGGDIHVDRQVIETMMAPFEHMIRNAVVHGLEGAEERERAGKSPRGEITISMSQQGSELVVGFNDDGRGLALGKLKSRASELGLLDPQGAVSEVNLLQIITQPGYTTSESLSMEAGRGVGMDVVYQAVRDLGGSMSMSHTAGRGVSFNFRLPVTLAVTQALLVRVGNWRFAIRSRSIERLVRFPASEIRREGDDRFIMIEDNAVPLVLLRERLDSVTPAALTGTIPVVLVRLADRLAAFAVDEFVDSIDIVSKNPGTQLVSIPEISGVTVLPDSTIVLILDPEAFIHRIGEEFYDSGTEGLDTTSGELRRVLVVDDSLVVRRVMQKDLEADGLEVETAIDGVNALEILEKSPFDVALVDIEMPRMNGYELLQHMREDPRYHSLPVIIITSRSGEQHRKHAIELGADGYITKPYDVSALDRLMRAAVSARRQLH